MLNMLQEAHTFLSRYVVVCGQEHACRHASWLLPRQQLEAAMQLRGHRHAEGDAPEPECFETSVSSLRHLSQQSSPPHEVQNPQVLQCTPRLTSCQRLRDRDKISALHVLCVCPRAARLNEGAQLRARHGLHVF